MTWNKQPILCIAGLIFIPKKDGGASGYPIPRWLAKTLIALRIAK